LPDDPLPVADNVCMALFSPRKLSQDANGDRYHDEGIINPGIPDRHLRAHGLSVAAQERPTDQTLGESYLSTSYRWRL
jgi:hypothetical protein